MHDTVLVPSFGFVEDNSLNACLIAEPGVLEKPCKTAHPSFVTLRLEHHFHSLAQGYIHGLACLEEVLTILFPKQTHRHAGLAQFLCDILQTPGKILEAFLAVRCITARIAVLKHRILQLQQAVRSDGILVHELDILADSLLVHAKHTSDLAV